MIYKYIYYTTVKIGNDLFAESAIAIRDWRAEKFDRRKRTPPERRNRNIDVPLYIYIYISIRIVPPGGGTS